MSPMSLHKYTARLANKTVYNPRYARLDFELVSPPRIEFVAGQYIILNLPDGVNKRQYSITSYPDKDHGIDLLIDIKPDGVGSQYLASLDFGAEIEFMGPAGQFVVQKTAPDVKQYFVATGAGIAPMRSMIQTMLIDEHDPRPIHLFWGMRYPEDIFWEEEFYEFAKQYPQFDFELILSKPPAGWRLSQGYVTDLLNSMVDDYHQSHFYLCGGSQMIEDSLRLLETKGVNLETQVHREKFW